MTFKRLSEYLSKLEQTASRNAITVILSELFQEAHSDEIGKLSYLLQGRVAPLFEAIEFGVADRMMMRAIALGLSIDQKDVEKTFKREGDLGKAVEKLKNIKAPGRELSISEVYDMLSRVATSSGEGSQDVKIKLLGELIHNVDPLSARYAVRITLAKLRMGFSDMTMLDSFSWMLSGTKVLRPEIEKAYNVRPDLGYIATLLKKSGMEDLKKVKPKVGTPILMARAERLSNAREIIEKIGRCAVEPKIDGFRLQVHFDKDKVILYTRNLENSTFMYPDVVTGVREQIKAQDAIFEGEAVGYDPVTGQYLPFQEIVQRKRKYDIEAKAKEVPLKLVTFDALYINGESLLHQPYEERRAKLERIIGRGNTILLAEETIVESPKDLQFVFDDAVTRGLEGIVAKKLDGVYQAGARGWSWIKLKKSYDGKLTDTIDAVIMGYDFGQGKRTGFGIGAFLIGIYDEKHDKYESIAKIGTGLTDEEWKELKDRSNQYHSSVKPVQYEVDKAMSCDIWVTPTIVVEIRADEITRSPVHTAGRVMEPSKSGSAFSVKEPGYALRFPRLERFRKDKNPDQITTLKEIKEMAELQYKHK